MAGFEVSIYGRFWVSTEALAPPGSVLAPPDAIHRVWKEMRVFREICG